MMEIHELEEQADRAVTTGEFAAARSLLEQAVAGGASSFALWQKLSAVRKASGDLRGALAAIDQALAFSPLDFSALLARAVMLDQLGEPGSGEAYGQALAQLRPGEEIPREMQAVVAHARKRSSEFRDTLQRYLKKRLPTDLSPDERARAERFVSNRSRNTRHYHQQPSDFHYPGLPEIEFHDRTLFPGLAVLEQATCAIREEFDALIAAEAAEMVPYIQYPERLPLRQWKELNNNPKWSAIHLLQNGYRVETNARHCPRTLEAIAAMDQPTVPGASPVAMFSLLAPRTRIPPHAGVANTRLVCHLPLIVPDNCGFRCGEEIREWRVGEAFIFDDTIEHEAWNDSDELRVVLIIDLWPPALGPGDRRTVAAVIGASNANFVASHDHVDNQG